MFLYWLSIHVDNVVDLLWHLHRPPPTLFALIIGINKYADPEVPDLCSAINDANAVEEFLTSKLRVSTDRMVNLRDEEATREAIMTAMQNLAHNNAISPQDPILIYYAGHGSEAQPPIPRWETTSANGAIQMLLPHDFKLKGSNDPQGQGIFDVTLSQALADIATNKSDNITVILDCCHSGSATRKSPNDETLAVRSIELPSNYTIPADIFTAELQVRSIYPKIGMHSHVLLAACKQGQSAYEIRNHGVFTSALLSLLEQEGIQRLTYTDVIRRLPDLPSQNPQCEGVNRNRLLFDSKVHNPYVTLYHVRPTPGKPNQCTLEAGEAHGVTKGAEFVIYSDTLMTSAVGSVVAVNTAPFTTQCSAVDGTLFTHSQLAYALQTRVGKKQDIRLFIEPHDAFLDLFIKLGQDMQRSNTDPRKRSFRLVNDACEEPDLVIRTHEGLVRFEIRDRICRQYGLTYMPFNDVGADETEYLLTILRSAADFYWRLRYSNKDSSLTQRVKVECFELVPTGELTPELDDVFEANGQNLNLNGVIFADVKDDVDTLYGYRIINTSNKPLYVALFYFDMSDLSIAPYYLPGTAGQGQADFSLPANGSLTIGFGDGGWAPRTYYLRENQDVDVGFLKLYVSTTYVDYSIGIEQPSPFQRSRGNIFTPRNRGFWGALTIPIIQRRVRS
ncbi:hypothetical protein C0995_011170 [Termitomyces sp. Mi166|nr:hypothetical protein C0995_011170 [Termitomyces sp. Mi166\